MHTTYNLLHTACEPVMHTQHMIHVPYGATQMAPYNMAPYCTITAFWRVAAAAALSINGAQYCANIETRRHTIMAPCAHIS